MMKNLILPFAFVILALAGLAGWIVFSTPENVLDLGEDTPSLDPPITGQLHPTVLTDSEQAAGFRVRSSAEHGVTTFVHPNSPCWLELPNTSTSTPSNTPGPTDFVGPDACASCHPAQYSGFIETAHAQTSNQASGSTIDGSFAPGENELATVHPDMSFRLLKEDEQHFQEVNFRGLKRKIPFNIVTGSGKSAQTYLFWEEDRLYQMHLSYFKPLKNWINSPGYHDGTAWYTRETIPKCVQCHMTYMEWKPGSTNAYVKDATIFGVSCERCHGPARKHVEHHQDKPEDKVGRYIANPSKLAPERTNDVCSQCHLGTAKPLQEPFSFRPGDKLLDHFEIFPEEDGKGQVHTSNQLQRMQLSQCYLESEGMTCVACHNPHQNERGNKKLFSERCLQCHEINQCGQHESLGSEIQNNCIDCHMGMGYDDNIQIQTTDSIHMPLLRDHYIRVIPEATKQYLREQSSTP